MATAALVRNPLASKSYSSQQAAASGVSLPSARKPPSAKRARSPEPPASNAHETSSKRAKAAPDSAATGQDRKSRRVEREQEFREKYGRAFPGFTFYFDVDCLSSSEIDVLEKRVTNMGAVSHRL